MEKRRQHIFRCKRNFPLYRDMGPSRFAPNDTWRKLPTPKQLQARLGQADSSPGNSGTHLALALELNLDFCPPLGKGRVRKVPLPGELVSSDIDLYGHLPRKNGGVGGYRALHCFILGGGGVVWSLVLFPSTPLVCLKRGPNPYLKKGNKRREHQMVMQPAPAASPPCSLTAPPAWPLQEALDLCVALASEESWEVPVCACSFCSAGLEQGPLFRANPDCYPRPSALPHQSGGDISH